MTSQIFANLYLNEFDHFVRHNIKPLGYIRYGDDFVLLMTSHQEAVTAKNKATDWLLCKLNLKMQPKNNIIFKAKTGLHFLGHRIYPFSPVSIDKVLQRKINQKISPKNAASFRAMHLPIKLARQILWRLV